MEKDIDDLYQRQADIDINIPDTIAIVGCGGVGSWVALLFAMIGIKKMYIFDDDTLSFNNRNRIPLPESCINNYKVNAMSEFIRNIRDCEVIGFKKQFNTNYFKLVGEQALTLVIDCTDNLDSQVEISKWCSDNKIRYIRVGVTTNHITITSELEIFGEDSNSKNNRLCGVTVPAWVAPCVLSASLALIKAVLNNELEVSLDVTKINTMVN